MIEQSIFIVKKSKDKYLKKTHIIQLFILSKYAMRNNIFSRKLFKWANSFSLKKDAKNEYWLSAVKDSATSTVQKKAKNIKKVSDKSFKLKVTK